MASFRDFIRDERVANRRGAKIGPATVTTLARAVFAEPPGTNAWRRDYRRCCKTESKTENAKGGQSAITGDVCQSDAYGLLPRDERRHSKSRASCLRQLEDLSLWITVRVIPNGGGAHKKRKRTNARRGSSI